MANRLALSSPSVLLLIPLIDCDQRKRGRFHSNFSLMLSVETSVFPLASRNATPAVTLSGFAVSGFAAWAA